MNFTKEEIKSANYGDILTYAKFAGIALKNDSRDTLKCVEHDSMIITPSKNMWFWNSRSEHGQGALSFAIKYQGLSFVDAMKAVLNSGACTVEHKLYKPKPRKPFVFNQDHVNKTCDRAYKYLHDVRGITKETFDYLYNIGAIREDKLGNIMFIWRGVDDKEIKGVSKQGTTTDKNKYGKHGAIKQIAKNSDYGYGFWFDTPNSERIDNVRFFESPIDAISFYELSRIKGMKNTRFISMDGLKKEVILNMLNLTVKQYGAIKTVGLGVDNDQAGKTFVKKMQNCFANVLDCTPSTKFGKDWNDSLKGIEKIVSKKN